MAICVAMLAATMHAQTEKDAEKAFSDSVLKLHLIPRGFSADREVDYRWTADRLIIPEAKWRTLGVLVADSVTLHDGRLEVRGPRRTLVKDSQDRYALTGGGLPVLLTVDFGGADPATVLPGLKMFYMSIESALADVPGLYRDLVPAELDANNSIVRHRIVPAALDSPCGVGSKPSDLQEPKMVHGVVPKLPDVPNQTLGAVVTLDSTGYMSNLWLTTSSAANADEQVPAIMNGFTFKPATCKGHPITVAMQWDVTFHAH
jgi:hypothetical protein